MSNNITVEQFAAELRRPVDDLLNQLKSAGLQQKSGSDNITSDDKKRLLAYLQKSHGSDNGTISIGRKKAEVSTVDGVQVETRRRARRVVVPTSEQQAEEAKNKAAEEALKAAEQAEAQKAEAARLQAEKAAAEKAAAEKAKAEAEAAKLKAEKSARPSEKAPAAAKP